MSIIHAIILGLIQGLGEFLPISSSGHLVVIPYIFGWDYQGLNFDVALHFGTVLAIIIYFWRDWKKIIAGAISPSHQYSLYGNLKKQTGNWQPATDYPPNLFWIILIASIPAAIAGYFLENLAQHALRNPLLVAILLAAFGLLLWLADAADKGDKKIINIGYAKGIIIGIAQAVALFPGVSRSGITTTAGLFLNLDRRSATRFSFLLATPAMIGAFVLTLKDFQPQMINSASFVAVLVSIVSGFFAIKYLLRYLEKHGFLPFVIYRLALATLIIILYFNR